MKRKRWQRPWLWLLSAVLLLALTLAVYFKTDWRVGFRSDSYRNVAVYHNSRDYTKSHGRHYAENGYYYGQKWQCVEFIKRFYHQAFGHEMPDVMGHAYSFFDPEIAHAEINPARAMIQFQQGENEKPAVDDLLVIGGTYGHVAIVSAVGDDWIEVVQQNILHRPRERFALQADATGWSVQHPQVLGWLRLP